MPLGHPIAASPSSNFGEPAIAISFALAKPGESVDDFQLRIARRGQWGQSLVGRQRVEIVLTDRSIGRLLELLASDRR